MLNSFRLVILLSIAIMAVYYYSDIQFTIKDIRAAIPSPETDFKGPLKTPAQEATFEAGTRALVSWDPDYSMRVLSYRLELWLGSAFVYLISSSPPEVHSQTWAIPAILNPGRYTLRLYTVNDTQMVTPYKSTLVNIVGIRSNDPDITITAPTAKNTWVLASSNTINFAYSKTTFTKWAADIYSLTSNSIVQYGQRILEKETGVIQEYTFKIPLEWAPGQYFVQFYIYGNGFDFKTARSELFTVKSFVGTVTATPELIMTNFPSFNYEAKKESTINIAWTTNENFKTFNIELFNNNENFFSDPFVLPIANTLSSNTRNFQWTVPRNLPSSRFYYVRVWGYLQTSDDSLKTGVSYSDFFTIRSANGYGDGDLEPPCSSDCPKSVPRSSTLTSDDADSTPRFVDPTKPRRRGSTSGSEKLQPFFII